MFLIDNLLEASFGDEHHYYKEYDHFKERKAQVNHLVVRCYPIEGTIQI